MGVHLAGHSISLDGDIAVNFYMELSDDLFDGNSDPYMLFNIPNTSTEYQTQYVYLNAKDGEQRVVAKPVEGRENIYMFKCRVAAKDMESEISAQMFNGDDKSVIYTYSVKKYADYLIEHKNDSAAYEKAVPLVQAMLSYGENAANYFSDDEPLADLDVDIPESSSSVTGIAEDLFDGATLSLKSQTSLSLYFVSDQDVTLTATDKYGNPCVCDYDHNGNEYVIRIRNIAPNDLEEPITVTVSDGENTGTVTYSPLTYCYKAQQTSTNSKLVNTVKALYNYHREATDYFEPQAGGGE